MNEDHKQEAQGKYGKSGMSPKTGMSPKERGQLQGCNVRFTETQEQGLRLVVKNTFLEPQQLANNEGEICS